MKSVYTGSDELDVMECAVNYNSDLIHSAIKHKPKAAKAMLDFGAGTGLLSSEIQKKCSDAKIFALEPDEKLRQKISNRALPLAIISDLTEVSNDSIEFVYTFNVLEHIEDELSALKILQSKMKKQSRIYIYVPAFMLLFSSNDRKVGHFRRYRKAQLSELMEKAGFRILGVRYRDTIGFFTTLAFKFLDRKNDGSINRAALRFFDRWLFPLNKILDPIFGYFLGKNVELIAEKNGG